MTEDRKDDDPFSTISTPSPPLNDSPPLLSTGEPRRPDEAGKPDSTTKKCECSDAGRNLVVCLDGTANQYGSKNTNVIELYSFLKKSEEDDRQLTFYNSGIGTYARPSWKSWSYVKQVIDHKIDLAIAWNFERIILEAYHWLSENYKPRDRIFLFGFSRGAYQVRALSAMIHKVGLLYKGNAGQIPLYTVSFFLHTESNYTGSAYELYADPKTGDSMYYQPSKMERPSGQNSNTAPSPSETKIDSDKTQVQPEVNSASPKKGTKAENFKRTFSRDVSTHFVGTWDTVSSVGIVRHATLPYTTDGMGHVCFFRHALALDERRVKYSPEYAYGGNTLPEDSPETPEASAFPHTKEVWFAGTHSDIGGGNVDNPFMDRTRPPLRWMSYEATAAGLRMRPFEFDLSLEDNLENMHESLKGMWWFLELLPLKRPSYKLNKPMTHWPHLGAERKLKRGQKIHKSVKTAFTAAKYTPKAIGSHGEVSSWTDLDIEEDLYNSAHDAVRKLLDSFSARNSPDPEVLLELRHIASSAEGRRALIEALIDSTKALRPLFATLQSLDAAGALTLDFCRIIVQALLDLAASEKQVLDTRSTLRSLASKLLTSSSLADNQLASQFLLRFSTAELQKLPGGPSVLSVAFSPDGRHIVSGLRNNHIRIWDATTMETVGELLEGHEDAVNSVAFSPDGNFIVSGSADCTVRIWDAKTRKAVGEPLDGHADAVNCVAFSPDGQRIVSGSYEGTIRIWDATTREAVGEALEGNRGCVSSVAFSPDNMHIIAGLSDRTVRFWDAATGKAVGAPLEGHRDWVSCVAFSPDGRHVLSGSYDKTVRIWDAATRKAVGEPFEGHRGGVDTAAFSPDGKRIVSGSYDDTVRIWDAASGAAVGEPLGGHRRSIKSVIFSPDGRSVVSGSWDGSIRIWDAIGTSIVSAQ